MAKTDITLIARGVLELQVAPLQGGLMKLIERCLLTAYFFSLASHPLMVLSISGFKPIEMSRNGSQTGNWTRIFLLFSTIYNLLVRRQ